MKFKGVEGGTATGEPLCRTCRHCIRIQGKALSQIVIRCNAGDSLQARNLDFEAYDCSEYVDKRMPSMYDMEKEAWILRSDNRTKTVGFVSPAQKEEHRKLLED